MHELIESIRTAVHGIRLMRSATTIEGGRTRSATQLELTQDLAERLAKLCTTCKVRETTIGTAPLRTWIEDCVDQGVDAFQQQTRSTK